MIEPIKDHQDLDKPYKFICPNCKAEHNYTFGYEVFTCSCGYEDKINWMDLLSSSVNDVSREFIKLQHQINKDIIECLAVLDVYSSRILESRDSFKQLLNNVEKQGEIINGRRNHN